jgi:hypothetical protein
LSYKGEGRRVRIHLKHWKRRKWKTIIKISRRRTGGRRGKKKAKEEKYKEKNKISSEGRGQEVT